MKFRLVLQVLFLLLFFASCRVVRDYGMMKSQICQGLFRTVPTPSSNDSYPPDRYIPPEAQNAIGHRYFSDLETALVEQYSLTCQPDLEVLSSETVEEGPASHFGTMLLSPSGRLIAMAICCGEDSRIEILDLATHSRQKISGAYAYLAFWSSETELFTSDIDDEATKLTHLDIVTGENVPYTVLWHYDGPDPERMAGEFYTGWQAAEVLEVSNEAICRAANTRNLSTVLASDGSALITRDKLLEVGPQLVRDEYSSLISREMVVEMKNLSKSVHGGRSRWRNSPVQQVDWGYALIFDDLSGPHQRTIVFTSDETLLTGIPLVESSVRIYHHGWKESLDASANFFVAPNLCQIEGTYQSVLYRRGRNDSPPVALGILPYPHSDAASADWSSDNKYIYIQQFAFGRYSISRVDLGKYLNED